MTLLGWMLYVMLVGALLALAAWLLEQGAARFRLPLRWIWVTALALGVLIPAWALVAPIGAGAHGGIGPVEVAVSAQQVTSPEGGLGSAEARPLAWGGGLILVMNRALQGASDAMGGQAELNALLGWGWGAASVSLLALLIAGGVRLRRQSTEWIPTRLGEREVLVAPSAGPAVVGLLRPRIVIPARYRELEADEVHLILEHETEHVRARDPLLLAMSLFPLLLAPWNPAAWWAFHRLRAAVEVDCDRRVLAGGARPARYGELLLRMGLSRSRDALPALSLAGSPSTLERRLNAMTDSSTRNALPVSIICGALAVGIMVLACQADTPTAPVAEEAVQQEATEAEAPTFTPFTVAPEVRNRAEISTRLRQEYPSDLREAGIGGTAVTHIFIDDEGVVQNVLLAETSGHAGLDEAALRVASTFEFSPAFNRDQRVPVWIQIPITFQTESSERSGEDEATAEDAAGSSEDDRALADEARAAGDVAEAPRFTPFTVAPEIRNRQEIGDALMREYPSELRDAGIGGTVLMHIFVDDEGVVQNAQVAESSGHPALDEAADRVARAFQFSPALNREVRVPVWIQIPITFATR